MIPWLVVALFGAIVCTVCDHLHVVNGVLAYPRVAFWGEAWWVPLLFGTVSVAVVWGARTARSLLGGRLYPAHTLFADVIAFVTAYALTAYAHALPNVVLWVLVAAWAARVVAGTPAWVVAYSLAVGVAGPAFEIGWSKLGFFTYAHPDFLGVPRWLPALYLHVAFAGASFARRFE